MKGTNKTSSAAGGKKGTKIRTGGNTVRAGSGGNAGKGMKGKSMKNC